MFLRKLTVLAVAAVTLFGSVALAHGDGPKGRRGHGRLFKAMINLRIEEALDAAKASPAQRAAVHALRDRAFESAVAQRRGFHPKGQWVEAFAADRLDEERLAALRTEGQGRARAMGNVAVAALQELHGMFTAPQRVVLAAQVREHLDRRAGRGGHFAKGIDARVEEGLAAIQATPAQRKVVAQAVERFRAAVEEERDHRELVGRVLALFVADPWDGAKVGKLRAEAEARMQAKGEAMLQGVRDVHAALSPEQRRALVELFKSRHHGRMEQRGLE